MSLLSPEQVAGLHQTFHEDLKPAFVAVGGMTVSAVNKEDLRQKLLDLQRAVCRVAEEAGFNPVQLTTSVHQGRDDFATPRYWLQERAPAGNWVDNLGSADPSSCVSHGRWTKQEHNKDVRVVERLDYPIWAPGQIWRGK